MSIDYSISEREATTPKQFGLTKNTFEKESDINHDKIDEIMNNSKNYFQ